LAKQKDSRTVKRNGENDPPSEPGDESMAEEGSGDEAVGEKSQPETVVRKTTVRPGHDFPLVALVPPERRERSVNDLNAVIAEAEERLVIAWEFKQALEKALPKKPAFFHHAWTAIRTLRDSSKAPPVNQESALGSLKILLEAVTLLRAVVLKQTRPDHPARAAFLTTHRLVPRAALVPEATTIIEAAKNWQNRFPALTDDSIADAEKALADVQAILDAKEAKRLGIAAESARDEARDQLALDVLLDSMDQLGAAAMVTLRKTEPTVVKRLLGALESGRQGSRGTEDGNEDDEGKAKPGDNPDSPNDKKEDSSKDDKKEDEPKR